MMLLACTITCVIFEFHEKWKLYFIEMLSVKESKNETLN